MMEIKARELYLPFNVVNASPSTILELMVQGVLEVGEYGITTPSEKRAFHKERKQRRDEQPRRLDRLCSL